MAITNRTKSQELRTKNNFGRIGVLMGGVSCEREISLRSGTAVYEALKTLDPDVVRLDIIDSNIERVRTQIKKAGIKVAFIALHGRFGEDGIIQKLLEEMDIPYTGSGIFASRLALNKIAARDIFKKSGLLIPRAQILNKNNPLINNFKKLPVVVKPANSGSSIGLTIVEKEEGLKTALQEAFNHDTDVLLEEYIQGRECTVSILEERPLPVIEIIPKAKFFDYQAKYTKGMTEYIVPANLEKGVYKRVQEAGLTAHNALGCSGFSRVDIIIDRNNNSYVLELNTIPGMTQTSLLPKAAASEGINFSELCLKLLTLALMPDKRKICAGSHY